MRLTLLLLLTLGTQPVLADATDDVSKRLDAFHLAAATADFEVYFSIFANDGVFLGTDRSERWTVEEFRQYAKPAFDAGRGWIYVMSERHIMLSEDGQLAWFDEVLQNEKLGPCRGTGVFRREDGAWRLLHYSLSMLVPNEIAYDVGTRSLAVEQEAPESAP